MTVLKSKTLLGYKTFTIDVSLLLLLDLSLALNQLVSGTVHGLHIKDANMVSGK